MALTVKQEKFCQAYVETGDASEAYRSAYSADKMKPETVHNKAYQLRNQGEIRARIRVNGVMITGRVGYTANYAVYVHNASGKLKGQPREDFGKTRDGVSFGGGTGKGNYWDPNAKPKFLQAGFEEARQEIDEAIKREMRR